MKVCKITLSGTDLVWNFAENEWMDSSDSDGVHTSFYGEDAEERAQSALEDARADMGDRADEVELDVQEHEEEEGDNA